MTRDQPKSAWLTYDLGNPASALLSSQDAQYDWNGGWQMTLGRQIFDCYALEVTYWGLAPQDSYGSVRDPGDMLATPLDMGALMAGGVLIGNLFDGAREHRVARRNEFHNVEVNFLRVPTRSCGARIDWLVGFRYFRFDEDFLFSSVDAGVEFGTTPLAEGYYEIAVDNDLYGMQLGARANWDFCRFGFHASPKFGVYGNRISHRSQLYRGDGATAFDIRSDKTETSLMAELELGVHYRFGNRWRLFSTYRALAITRIATADDQIPPFLEDAAGIADIDASASMILHGFAFGAELTY